MAKETGSIPKEVLIAASAAEQIRNRVSEVQIKDDEELQSKAQSMAALGAIAALQGTASVPQDDLQRQLMATLIENLQHDMAKKRKKEAEEEENMRRLMLARTESIKHEKAQRAYTQSVCDHRKENGHSRVCGQRLSNGHLSLLCNLCYKQWSELDLPPHLQVPMDVIGG